VIAFDPPVRLEFTWHPDGPSDRSQTVDVEFQVEADGTRVTLILYRLGCAGSYGLRAARGLHGVVAGHSQNVLC